MKRTLSVFALAVFATFLFSAVADAAHKSQCLVHVAQVHLPVASDDGSSHFVASKAGELLSVFYKSATIRLPRVRATGAREASS